MLLKQLKKKKNYKDKKDEMEGKIKKKCRKDLQSLYQTMSNLKERNEKLKTSLMVKKTGQLDMARKEELQQKVERENKDMWEKKNELDRLTQSIYDNNNSLNNSAPKMSNLNSYSTQDDDYENEPPLLEELGIRFDHIWSKTQAVLYPVKQVNEHILDDADLAGPIFFCLLLGSCMLLSGKVHFGYIYGFSVFGCFGLQTIINLMHPVGLDFSRTCSVLGYCLLPVIVLAASSIILNLKGTLGFILAAITIAWSTGAATRLLNAKLGLTEQYWLVAYPVMLMYSCFVLITIF